MKDKIRKYVKIALPALGGLLAVGLGLFLLLRPRFVWIVEDRFVEKWEKTALSSPFKMTKLAVLSSIGPTLPNRWYGYRIVSRYSDGAEAGSPIRVYPGLAAQGRSEDALLLALDPWLVFRKAATPPLNREAAERGATGSGQIFMAGSDRPAVRAWTAQLLQESPGVFSQDTDRWNRFGERLFIGRNFQPGASTYHWEQVWPHLLAEGETVWVYCPLSRVRQLPDDGAVTLKADAFPTRPGWSEYGLQAEMLWAIPYESQKNRRKMASAEAWLQSAPAQAQIAGALGWLPARQQAAPPDPVLKDAQAAWLAASYVWEEEVKSEK